MLQGSATNNRSFGVIRVWEVRVGTSAWAFQQAGFRGFGSFMRAAVAVAPRI